MPARLANAEVIDSGEIASHVVPAIAETVKKQVEIGIDCINDGEFWTARSLAHYAAHFTGLEARPVKVGEPPTTRHSTRERDEFRAPLILCYASPETTNGIWKWWRRCAVSLLFCSRPAPSASAAIGLLVFRRRGGVVGKP
jgi:hypothetical protein